MGAETFVERLRPALQGKRPKREIPRRQRFATRPALATLFGSGVLPDLAPRNEATRRAHLEHGYSLSAIGQAFNHQSHREPEGRDSTRQDVTPNMP